MGQAGISLCETFLVEKTRPTTDVVENCCFEESNEGVTTGRVPSNTPTCLKTDVGLKV